MATVCKTVERKLYAGSNPALSTIIQNLQAAHIAQLVEHILGKNEVNSSILFVGFFIS